jgi:ribosomal protein S18 acetylase RimI-like enzyme
LDVVEIVDEVTDEIVEALKRLLPQLSTTARPPEREELEAIVSSSASNVLVARDHEGDIVGTLTLVVFQIPTGVRAWIEDVVVDERARGRGIGSALTKEALELARAARARTVNLTSRPSRGAANALYQNVGFKQRKTHVYRYIL